MYLQQRFEEMESKINELRDQIEIIKTEKSLLEKRVQAESEVCVVRIYYNLLFTAEIWYINITSKCIETFLKLLIIFLVSFLI